MTVEVRYTTHGTKQKQTEAKRRRVSTLPKQRQLLQACSYINERYLYLREELSSVFGGLHLWINTKTKQLEAKKASSSVGSVLQNF